MLLLSYPFSLFFRESNGSVIVSFEMCFKTPLTESEGLAKLRDAVDNRKLGNFTVEALRVIQTNPTTAATGNPSNSSKKGNLTVKKERDIRTLSEHDIDSDNNVEKSIGLKTQQFSLCITRFVTLTLTLSNYDDDGSKSITKKKEFASFQT